MLQCDAASVAMCVAECCIVLQWHVYCVVQCCSVLLGVLLGVLQCVRSVAVACVPGGAADTPGVLQCVLWQCVL